MFHFQSNYFDSPIPFVKFFTPKKPRLPRRRQNLSNFQLWFKAPPPIPFTPISIPSKSWQVSSPSKSYSFCYTLTIRKLPQSSIQSSPGVFQLEPTGPSNPSFVYSLKFLKNRRNFVRLVEDMYHGCELTVIFQVTLHLFGIQRSKHFASFL